MYGTTEFVFVKRMEKIRVFTAFSGYDSQCMALERLKVKHPDFDYELVGWSEIDENAIKLHDANFPEAKGRNYGDICKIDWDVVPGFDLFTCSFPCTDISGAGRQAGLEEGTGTRSSLLWECRRAIVAKKPKYILMENVKALTQKKFLPYLKKWQAELNDYGYENFTQVLNACDYGVPQNRERVFMVSIRKDVSFDYKFPQKMELKKQLADVLEDNVPENYYLSDEAVAKYREKTNDREIKDLI